MNQEIELLKKITIREELEARLINIASLYCEELDPKEIQEAIKIAASVIVIKREA